MRLHANASIGNRYHGTTVLRLLYRIRCCFVVNVPSRSNFRNSECFSYVCRNANCFRRLKSVLRRTNSNPFPYCFLCQTARISVRCVQLYFFCGPNNARRNFHIFAMCLGNSKTFFVTSNRFLDNFVSKACRDVAQSRLNMCRVNSGLFTRRTGDKIDSVLRQDRGCETFTRICITCFRLFAVFCSLFNYGDARGAPAFTPRSFVWLSEGCRGGAVFRYSIPSFCLIYRFHLNPKYYLRENVGRST